MLLLCVNASSNYSLTFNQSVLKSRHRLRQMRCNEVIIYLLVLFLFSVNACTSSPLMPFRGEKKKKKKKNRKKQKQRLILQGLEVFKQFFFFVFFCKCWYDLRELSVCISVYLIKGALFCCYLVFWLLPTKFSVLHYTFLFWFHFNITRALGGSTEGEKGGKNRF